jgi:choline/glycine/proline betaine transport protein
MADSEDTTGELSDGLQVELFHPESEREPGDTNFQGYGFDIHPVVFPVALVVIAVFVASTIILGEQASAVYTAISNYINNTFGWFYILSMNIFIVTVLYFALSKYGKIRIGGVEAETEFSTVSWMAMLFSAGMGIGLMFFSVAEPMNFFSNIPPYFASTGSTEAGTLAAAAPALAQTFFHWGIHPWAVYALVGLGLAFFSFNRGLPLTFRSIFWPLLGERIYGWPGHIIDLLTVFATLFGLATSLGLGVAQINTGISFVAGNLLGIASIPVNDAWQIALIIGITLIATASVAAGLEGGVKRLSTINLYLMFALLGFMLIVGPTFSVLSGLVGGFGTYLVNLPGLSFFTGAFTQGTGDFFGSWTIFYWGWWISWSPFVGMFIARISKGRTIREFVFGVLILPSLFSFVWLSTFGGSALFAQLDGAGILAALQNQGQTIAMFSMLSQYPLGVVTSILATFLVVTFFVTSSDSGSLVVDHLTSGGKHDVPKAQRIFWALTEGAVAALLLWGGGLQALRTASVSTGLPFAVILLLMCYTVYLGLKNEYEILESEAFREQIQDISESEDMVVTSSGGDIVTDVSDGGETTSDD